MDSLYPAHKKELIFGIVYLPVHVFLMPIVVSIFSKYVFVAFKLSNTGANMTLIYYGVSFVILMIFMRGFLKDSFSVLIDSGVSAITFSLVGYFQYFMLVYAMSAAFMLITKQSGINPNSAAVSEQISSNSKAMILSTVVLAPIVEETLFRGALFGLIRRKNRVAAFIVSYLFFSVYHLWAYALEGISPIFVFYLLQYLPGSYILARCYEKSGTIWSPVMLHMMINGVSVLVSLSL